MASDARAAEISSIMRRGLRRLAVNLIVVAALLFIPAGSVLPAVAGRSARATRVHIRGLPIFTAEWDNTKICIN